MVTWPTTSTLADHIFNVGHSFYITIIQWESYFYHFLTFNIVSILIYDCMAEPVLGRLPGRPLTHCPASILMVAGPFILLLFIKHRIFDYLLTFCIVLKLIYHYMAELVLGWLPGRPLAHWPTIFLMVATPFISLLFNGNCIFYHFLMFNIVSILIYDCMAKPVLGRLPGQPLTHRPTSTLTAAGPPILLLFIKHRVFDHFWTFCIVLKLID